MFTERPDLAFRPGARPPAIAAGGAAPTPYRFDRAPGRAAPDPEAMEREAAVAAARAEGYDAGVAAGRRSAEAAAAEALSAAARNLGEALATLVAGLDASLADLRREAATAAIATGAQLARHLVAREPLAEIEALVADVLGPLRDVPHLVVRVRAEEAEPLSGRIGALAEEHGFAGRIRIAADPGLGAGDCRIEWADGGIVRSLSGAADEIGDALRRRFPALAAPSPALAEGDDR